MSDLAQLRRRYRVTEEWLLENLVDGSCGICGTDTKTLVIDHDHRCCPGVLSCGACVRGVLCHGCNIRLGRVEGGYGTTNLDWVPLAERYAGHHLNPVAIRVMVKRGPSGRPKKRRKSQYRSRSGRPVLPRWDGRFRVHTEHPERHFFVYRLSRGDLLLWPRPDWGTDNRPIGVTEKNLVDVLRSDLNGTLDLRGLIPRFFTASVTRACNTFYLALGLQPISQLKSGTLVTS